MKQSQVYAVLGIVWAIIYAGQVQVYSGPILFIPVGVLTAALLLMTFHATRGE